jgi:tRNA(Ile)-lysidine synthase
VIETIAINLYRKTGWRGLSVMDSDTLRPLLDKTKEEILDYAQKNNLKWHEDSTNASDKYLRNKMRRKLESLDQNSKKQILALRTAEVEIKNQIDREVAKILKKDENFDSRYFMTHVSETVGLELVRKITQAQLTRPQAKRLIHAIKTAKPGKKYQAGAGVEVDFSARKFTVKMVK